MEVDEFDFRGQVDSKEITLRDSSQATTRKHLLTRLLVHDLDTRHYALTPSLAGACFEALCMCLSKHYESPQEFTLESDSIKKHVSIEWPIPTDRIRAAHNNDIDAKEAGAYALAISAVEYAMSLYAVRRTETLTGADYYVSTNPEPPEDLEDCFRLEVSGTDGEHASVRTRLKQKLEQTQKGTSNLPAIAAVVGYFARLILIQTAK